MKQYADGSTQTIESLAGSGRVVDGAIEGAALSALGDGDSFDAQISGGLYEIRVVVTVKDGRIVDRFPGARYARFVRANEGRVVSYRFDRVQ